MMLADALAPDRPTFVIGPRLWSTLRQVKVAGVRHSLLRGHSKYFCFLHEFFFFEQKSAATGADDRSNRRSPNHLARSTDLRFAELALAKLFHGEQNSKGDAFVWEGDAPAEPQPRIGCHPKSARPEPRPPGPARGTASAHHSPTAHFRSPTTGDRMRR